MIRYCSNYVAKDTSWDIILENILSVRVFEWLVSLVGCNKYIYGKMEFEARESKIYVCR